MPILSVSRYSDSYPQALPEAIEAAGSSSLIL